MAEACGFSRAARHDGRGQTIRLKFTRTGRYLLICMNRGHSINDWMFGFINVVGDDDDK